MKSAVVTGANGFVGKALLNRLCRDGIDTFAVIHNTEAEKEIHKISPQVHCICCDMEKIQYLPNLVNTSVDVFFHLAWDGSSGEKRKDYKRQLRNVQWTVDAVRAAAELGCRRFVGAGSLVEYDTNSYIPMDGSAPEPVHFYAAAKLSAHYMSKIECNRYPGLAHCWAVLSHIYGIGDHTSNFVNFAAKLMLTGKSADFTEGKQLTDFVSVDDTARGLACIGRQGKANTSYYVGSNHPRMLKEYIQIIRDTIDPKIRLNLGAVSFHGVIHSAEKFDCSKLMEDTEYEPRETFEEGMQKLIPWVQEQIQMGNL